MWQKRQYLLEFVSFITITFPRADSVLTCTTSPEHTEYKGAFIEGVVPVGAKSVPVWNPQPFQEGPVCPYTPVKIVSECTGELLIVTSAII